MGWHRHGLMLFQIIGLLLVPVADIHNPYWHLAAAGLVVAATLVQEFFFTSFKPVDLFDK
jgi:hypothetical protein